MKKILFLTANPLNADALAVGHEAKEIESRLRAADRSVGLSVAYSHEISPGDIIPEILRHRPAVVHFSGHGSASGELVFVNELGRSASTDPAAIARVFEVLARVGTIRVVVLSACFSEAQARAIADHIDCVVGMARTVSDAAAIAFAGIFYSALEFGQDVGMAFDLACAQVGLRDSSAMDVPQLICRKGVEPRDVSLLDPR